MGLGRQTGAGGTGGRTWGCAMVHGSTQDRRQGWGWGQTEGWGLCQHALGSIRYEEKKGLEGQPAGQADGELHRSAAGCTGQGQRKGLGEQTDTGQKDGHGLCHGASGCMGRGLGYQTDSRTTGGEGGTALQCQWRAGHWTPTWGQTHRQTEMGWDGTMRAGTGKRQVLAEAWRAQKEQTSEQSPQPCRSPPPARPRTLGQKQPHCPWDESSGGSVAPASRWGLSPHLAFETCSGALLPPG